MGGILGMGSSRNSCLDAVAGRHAIFTLGHDTGKTRYVEAMEHAADHPDLFTGHLWDIPDPLRSTLLRPRFCPECNRPDVFYFYWSHIHRFSFLADLSLE